MQLEYAESLEIDGLTADLSSAKWAVVKKLEAKASSAPSMSLQTFARRELAFGCLNFASGCGL